MKRNAYLFLVIIVAFNFIISAAHGQEISKLYVSGKAEQLTDELLDKSVRDANGQLCAGVFIVSDLDGLAYEAYNGIVKTTRQTSKDLLFISADERVITVLKLGFGPLKLILNDLGIKLKPGSVWQVKVTGEKKLELIPISIVSNPTSADIFIDNLSKGTNPTQQCSPGKHTIRIEKSGYKSETRTVDVSSTNIMFQFTLESVEPLAVTITSQPAGAKISIGDVEKGETNKGIFLMPGKYRVKVLLSGYLPSEKEIEVAEGTDNKFNFVLSKNSGILHVEVTPSDARVLVNKEEYSGKSDIDLAPGSYKIEVSNQNYVSAAEVAAVELGKTTRKTFTLVARTGNLQVSVQPPEASVQLLRDGKVVQEWQGLKVVKGLMIGGYTMKSTAAGYDSLSREVFVEEGKTQPLDFALPKTSDRPKEASPLVFQRQNIIMETSLGTIELELYADDAPKTVKNFIGLAKQSFFDGIRFHRVVRGFVIQAGDDKSKDLNKKGEWGTGGQSIWKKEFADELNPATPSFKAGYKKGVLAMANRGPNTNTSQFFIMLVDNTTLPMNYTIFGKVVKGIEVVDKIGSVELEQAGARDGRPKTDVFIKRVTVAGTNGGEPGPFGIQWILVDGGPRGDFSMSATEVTFDQYDPFCQATGHERPKDEWGRGKQPVINVNMADAVAFCDWLSKKTGKKVRLPEEDEWEFAAKGGTKSIGVEFSGSASVDEVAWYDRNSGSKAHEVATKKPNELGLYDMSGNVFEWCGTQGVLRGGSWDNIDDLGRVSNRYRGQDRTMVRDDRIGFRLLQEK